MSPGHSRGSICFKLGTVLFSGDVLMYRRVGSTNIPQSSSPEKQVNSVRKLYRELDNKTVVYPGHGRSTDIGSEKIHNSEVTEESVNLKD